MITHTWNSTCTNTQKYTIEDVLKAAEEGKKILREKQQSEDRIRFLLRQYIKQTGDDWEVWAKRLNIRDGHYLRYFVIVCPLTEVPQWFYDNIRLYFQTEEAIILARSLECQK